MGRYSECYFCRRFPGGHEDGCPGLTEEGSPERREWNAGYLDGRTGIQRTEPPTPAYVLGWAKGEIAAEEANIR